MTFQRQLAVAWIWIPSHHSRSGGAAAAAGGGVFLWLKPQEWWLWLFPGTWMSWFLSKFSRPARVTPTQFPAPILTAQPFLATEAGKYC